MHFPIGFVKNSTGGLPVGHVLTTKEAQKAAMGSPCGLMSCDLAEATA